VHLAALDASDDEDACSEQPLVEELQLPRPDGVQTVRVEG
jgi:hypothetical protein